MSDDDRTPDRATDQVLARRARELAQPVRPERGDLVELLAFTAGGRRYVAPLAAIHLVARAGPVARAPRAPSTLLGTVNVRGALMAVFRLPTGAHDGPDPAVAWVVVLGQDTHVVAVAADAVTGVTHAAPHELLAPPAAGAEGASSFIRGVTDDGAVWLDVPALVADPMFRPYASAVPAGTDGR